MFPVTDSGGEREGEVLADRLESLAAWIQELDGRLSAAEVATGDAKTAKELRKALEALAKHDPKLEERLTNQVGVLKDRLATLGETVSTTSAGLAARDGELASLRRELEAERASLVGMSADLQRAPGPGARELEELRRTVAELSTERSRKRSGRGEGVPGNLEILEQRLDTLGKTVATTSASLASKDGELAALRRHVDEEGARVAAILAELHAAVDPAPLAELRLTVKELSDRTAAAGRQSRQGLDGLDARVESLAGQLEALGRTVAGTADGLAVGERDLGALRAAFDEETGRFDSHLTSVEQALGSLAPKLATLEDLPARGELDALDERLRGYAEEQQALTAKLGELAREVQETGRGYAEREHELAALSRRFEEARAGVDELVAEVRSEVRALAEAGDGSAELEARLDGLSGRVEELRAGLVALEDASAEARQDVAGVRSELGGALERLTAKVEALSGRLEGLSTAVDESGRGDAERERELAELSRHFEEGRAQVDSLVSDLRDALDTMPTPGPDPAQEERLEALAVQVREQATALAGATSGLAGRELELEALRAQVAALVANVDETGSGSAERERELAALRANLEKLAGQVDDVGGRLVGLVDAGTGAREEAAGMRAELGGALDQLAGRIEALEREHAEASRELAASAAARDAVGDTTRLLEERVRGVAESIEAVSRELDSLSVVVEASGRGDEVRERELAALARRFDEGRAQVDSLVSDLREGLETMPAPGADDELTEQVELLALRLESLAAETQSSASREETERLLGRLLLRLDSVEHGQGTLAEQLAGVTGAQELTGRLEEVTERLERLEHAGGVAAAEGEGRLRGEMRGLELRVQHAEDAAREHREAVLTQLERLASRVEWRLQRLEEDESGSTPGPQSRPAGGSAQVVPLRGNEV